MSIRISLSRTFVIIPAYNENAVIESVIEELSHFDYTLVIIDDGSATNLYPLLKDKPVYLLRHVVNLGQGAALQTGIEFALSKQAEYIVTFDADGQHDANDIGKLLQKLASNEADIVLGSRFMKGSYHNMTLARKIILQTARYLHLCLTGLLLTDAYNGLRAMNQTAAKSIELRANEMAHATELLSQIKKTKLRFAEVPVNVYYTPYSRKKGLTTSSSFRIFFDILLNKIFK